MQHNLLPISFSLALLLAATACTAAPAGPQDRDLPRPDSIDGDKVSTLLPPDAIRSIDDPRFVPASEADFMQPGEPVLGMVQNGVAKAYSIWHLDRHEIVNDRIGDDPVAVTW